MKLKLIIILAVVLGYLMVVLACNKKQATPTAALSNHPTTAAPAPPDGTDPPHAVDTSGKAIPASSATQPDKPIILAKDIDDPKWGETKPDAAFDHVKHSTDPNYSADGKSAPACVECHHTDQPSSTVPYLKKFERKEVLTAKQLETSKDAVKSCRACHFSPTSEETDDYPPKSVTYPAAMNKPPSGKLTNDVAYHINCIGCHNDAKKRDAKLKAPVTCDDCHTKKG
ncbi:MAG: hypothetical protein DMF68_08500 [Acidobacteria bacterium]|nr:MAG: hypothetical protein DMF68_08500 [Acidobacteriota bacterium]